MHTQSSAETRGLKAFYLTNTYLKIRRENARISSLAVPLYTFGRGIKQKAQAISPLLTRLQSGRTKFWRFRGGNRDNPRPTFSPRILTHPHKPGDTTSSRVPERCRTDLPRTNFLTLALRACPVIGRHGLRLEPTDSLSELKLDLVSPARHGGAGPSPLPP